MLGAAVLGAALPAPIYLRYFYHMRVLSVYASLLTFCSDPVDRNSQHLSANQQHIIAGSILIFMWMCVSAYCPIGRAWRTIIG
jgi:hypothetical protein